MEHCRNYWSYALTDTRLLSIKSRDYLEFLCAPPRLFIFREQHIILSALIKLHPSLLRNVPQRQWKIAGADCIVDCDDNSNILLCLRTMKTKSRAACRSDIESNKSLLFVGENFERHQFKTLSKFSMGRDLMVYLQFILFQGLFREPYLLFAHIAHRESSGNLVPFFSTCSIIQTPH